MLRSGPIAGAEQAEALILATGLPDLGGFEHGQEVLATFFASDTGGAVVEQVTGWVATSGPQQKLGLLPDVALPRDGQYPTAHPASLEYYRDRLGAGAVRIMDAHFAAMSGIIVADTAETV